MWVYKIIFPLLFALMPVALYQAYMKQSNEKLAFMASFFFVSLVVFFSEMLQLARQEIAELFVALIILLIVDRSMQKSRWSLLFLVFAASLVLSHYGLTFIFIGTLALGWALRLYRLKAQEGHSPRHEQATRPDADRRLPRFLRHLVHLHFVLKPVPDRGNT